MSPHNCQKMDFFDRYFSINNIRLKTTLHNRIYNLIFFCTKRRGDSYFPLFIDYVVVLQLLMLTQGPTRLKSKVFSLERLKKIGSEENFGSQKFLGLKIVEPNKNFGS